MAIAERAGKELIANETVWGARDDATHVEVMRYTLAQLTQRGIGFTVHAPHHSLVADLHRDSGPGRLAGMAALHRGRWLPAPRPGGVQRVRPPVGDATGEGSCGSRALAGQRRRARELGAQPLPPHPLVDALSAVTAALSA